MKCLIGGRSILAHKTFYNVRQVENDLLRTTYK